MAENIYSMEGDYGRVRVAFSFYTPADLEELACLSTVGWHSCNDLYRIERPQGHNEYLLLFTIKGTGMLKIGGSSYSLLPGTAAIIPPGIDNLYYTSPGESWEFYWVHPVGRWAESLCSRLEEALRRRTSWPCITNTDPAMFACQFEELIFYCHTGAGSNITTVSSHLSELLHMLLMHVEHSETPRHPGVSRKAMQYIENHYEKPLDIALLSRQVFLSSSHFIRVFRQETGFTPHEYLIRVRVYKALQLLRFSNKPIAEISRLVGFGQVSNFIAHFKRVTGTTPGALRGKDAR